MFVLYIGLAIIGIAGVLYFGLKISENIYHTTLKAFFWVLYITSILTLGNILATGVFYNVLRFKRGLPGDQGRIGDYGDLGYSGTCDTSCDSNICSLAIMDTLNKYYSNLISRALGQSAILNDNPVIRNGEITERIVGICKSNAYKQVSKIKNKTNLNGYIINIYQNWIKLLVESDTSDDKKIIRDYLETEGYDEKPSGLVGNPFKEIEKYDIYYWGSDRIFHPRIIEYCSDPEEYKGLTLGPAPDFKILRTNLYNQVYSSPRLGRLPFSVFRVGPYNHKSLTYYSLGDIMTTVFNQTSTNKFIEKYGVPMEEADRTTFQNSVNTEGPAFPTLLIAGPDKYLIPPQDWTMVWRNGSVNTKNPITIWRPKDFYDSGLKKWFRACGVLAVPNLLNFNPRQQYGYNTPEKQPIRLVAEELLENISDCPLKKVWDGRQVKGVGNLSIWRCNNVDFAANQNTSIAVSGYSIPNNLKLYQLKKTVTTVDEMKPLEFKNDIVDENKLGVGFHGSPHRSEKYSVFTWLEMPLEVQVTNLGNADKIYIRHSGVNIVNSYLIRKQEEGQTELNNYFSVDSNAILVKGNNKFNINNPNLIWEIVCVDKDGNMTGSNCKNKYYLIKNTKFNKYLKSEYDKTALGPITYIIDKIPNKTNINYSKIIQEFIWYNPLSATGNDLQVKNKNKK
jgi:hypothetical protein